LINIFSTISKKTMKLLVVSLSLFLSISQWATAQNTTEKEYLLKGSALYEAGELDSLISYFEEALTIYPNSEKVRYELAIALFE
jgi:tetratricopeptide (TPR) repeat protein